MQIDLTDEEATALLRELDGITDADRYFLSPRIRTLKAIRAKICPKPGAGLGAAPAAERYMRHRGSARGDGGAGESADNRDDIRRLVRAF
jgi:hypothetical protein